MAKKKQLTKKQLTKKQLTKAEAEFEAASIAMNAIEDEPVLCERLMKNFKVPEEDAFTLADLLVNISAETRKRISLDGKSMGKLVEEIAGEFIP